MEKMMFVSTNIKTIYISTDLLTLICKALTKLLIYLGTSGTTSVVSNGDLMTGLIGFKGFLDSIAVS
jgi:hypothetical protein